MSELLLAISILLIFFGRPAMDYLFPSKPTAQAAAAKITFDESECYYPRSAKGPLIACVRQLTNKEK